MSSNNRLFFSILGMFYKLISFSINNTPITFFFLFLLYFNNFVLRLMLFSYPLFFEDLYNLWTSILDVKSHQCCNYLLHSKSKIMYVTDGEEYFHLFANHINEIYHFRRKIVSFFLFHPTKIVSFSLRKLFHHFLIYNLLTFFSVILTNYTLKFVTSI